MRVILVYLTLFLIEKQELWSKSKAQVNPHRSDIQKSANTKLSKTTDEQCLKSLNLLLPPEEFPGILVDQPKPLLTLFTTWNSSPEKYLAHNLTLRNWISFSPFVIPVLFTNDSFTASIAREIGWKAFEIHQETPTGLPTLLYMYKLVKNHYNTFFYAYSDGNILFTESIICTLYTLVTRYLDFTQTPTLIVGKRTDITIVTNDEGNSWNNLTKVAKENGRLSIDIAVDYFIASATFPWAGRVPVVSGLPAYNKYQFYLPLNTSYAMIDATNTILAVHQGNKSGFKDNDLNLIILRQIDNHTKIEYKGAGCIKMYTYFQQGKIEFAVREVSGKCN